MRAIVVEAPGKIAFTDVAEPSVGPHDVLVRSHLAGICRTDVDIIEGKLTDPRWVRFPLVPGHEWAGTVIRSGDAISDLEPGVRVVAEGMIPCGRCHRCKRGATHTCQNYDQIGFTRGGGYGEQVLVPRHVLHRLPDRVSLEAAVLIEPAACVYRALRRADICVGETVGIVGIGTLGSLGVTLSRLWSPGVLIGYGVRDEELEFALQRGANLVIDVAKTDPVAETRQRIADPGLDVVVETAGSAAAVELACQLVRPGGRIVLLGIAGQNQAAQIPIDHIVLGDREIIGSCSYTEAAWVDVMRLLEHGRVDFEPLITQRFPAAAFADALTLMNNRKGHVVKILLEHDT